MRKNKYIVFIAIGFELVSLILVAIWLGDYLKNSRDWNSAPAFTILLAFLIWFISLMIKLKGANKAEKPESTKIKE